MNVPYEDDRIKWARGPFYYPMLTSYKIGKFPKEDVPKECKAKGNSIAIMNVPLLRDCVDSCLRKTWCNQFTWNKGADGLCYLAYDLFTEEASFDPFSYAHDKKSVDESCISGSVKTKQRHHHGHVIK